MYYNNKAAAVYEKILTEKGTDFAEARAICEKAIIVGRENRADFKHIAKALKRIGTCYEKSGDLKNGTVL